MKLKHLGEILTVIIAVAFGIVIFNFPPIEQQLDYHNFIDIKTILNIPNFWNVLSNLPFLIVGLLGLTRLNVFNIKRIQYLMFFIGILLVAFGSSYYHLNPNNDTLVWDRLPMTIAFMSLLSILISESINEKIGKNLLFPLLVLGFASVDYWLITSDLRLYVFVQFCPILIIPILLICFKLKINVVNGYWFLLLAYVIAKLFEFFDAQVFDYLNFSGHSLKHIISALGLFVLYKYYKSSLTSKRPQSLSN